MMQELRKGGKSTKSLILLANQIFLLDRCQSTTDNINRMITITKHNFLPYLMITLTYINHYHIKKQRLLWNSNFCQNAWGWGIGQYIKGVSQVF
jgi:hypothetical protein